MHPGLLNLIEAYQLSVSEAFAAFLDTGLCTAPGSHVQWAANGIAHKGSIASGGSYQKLQYGLSIERNGLTVAFDFGTEGQTDEFDAYRLTQYFDDNRPRGGLATPREVEAAFNDAIASGELHPTRSERYTLP